MLDHSHHDIVVQQLLLGRNLFTEKLILVCQGALQSGCARVLIDLATRDQEQGLVAWAWQLLSAWAQHMADRQFQIPLHPLGWPTKKLDLPDGSGG